MSGSFPIFDPIVRELLGWISPARSLDLGAGAGKYGRMLSEIAPNGERVCVEVSLDYVDRFGLRDVYQRVEVGDASAWWQENESEVFDLVIAGNCLEHLPKTLGQDLLNAMAYRSAWILVLMTEFIVQDHSTIAINEIHRSAWSERDLDWHDLWAWDNTRATTFALLRGYLPATISIDTITERLNSQTINLLDFDGKTEVRPCRLRLVDNAREVSFRPR